MAKFQSIVDFCKRPAFILSLILAAFFLRGVFLAVTIPMLRGQDESRHYITIQFLADSNADYQKVHSGERVDVDGLEKYMASEEFEKTVEVAGLSKPEFVEGYQGKNEHQIINNDWEKTIEGEKASILRGSLFYHKIAAQIEKALVNEDVFSRFYTIRILSVVFGTLAVLCAYFLFKIIGFSVRESLFLTTIISFQPALSSYFTNVNYDSLLILLFTIFMLGGVLFLKNGPNWKNISLLFFSLIFGLLTKGTSLILIVPLAFLFLFLLYQKTKGGRVSIAQITAIFSVFILTAVFVYYQFGIEVFTPPSNQRITLLDFLEENFFRADRVSRQYWGAQQDWATNYSRIFVNAIWVLEAVSLLGILIFFLKKKASSFLPQKKIIIFFIILLFSLQAGVLFTNWRLTASGAETLLTSPGRYFLPSLGAHLAVMFTGIGIFFRKQSSWLFFLAIVTILMIVYNFHIVFNIFIPKYFLY